MGLTSIAHLVTSNIIYPITASHTEIDRNTKITPNFTKGEWLDSVKVLNGEKERLIKDGVPLDKAILQSAQLVRNFTGKPVYLGSSYRSQAWEQSKLRDDDGDHPKGKAVDLNGEDVYSTIHNAFETKSELYQELKALGINAFGFYDWGVHLGTRPPKQNGKDFVWYGNGKKKSSIDTSYFFLAVVFIMYRKTIFKILKKIFKIR